MSDTKEWVYQMNERSLLFEMNPFFLLIGIGIVCIGAWICARMYRDTNDFKKSIKLYLPVTLIENIFMFFLLDIEIILCLGIDVVGIVALAIISNYYFYHD